MRALGPASDTFTLTYSADDHGTISGTTPQTVDYGADGTEVTAVPDPGYVFVQWSDGVTTAARTDTNVTTDIDVSAEFGMTAFEVHRSEWGTGIFAKYWPAGNTLTVTIDDPATPPSPDYTRPVVAPEPEMGSDGFGIDVDVRDQAGRRGHDQLTGPRPSPTP